MYLEGTSSSRPAQTYEPEPPPPPPPVEDPSASIDGPGSGSTSAGTGTGTGTDSTASASSATDAAGDTASNAAGNFVVDAINGFDSDGDRAVFELRGELKAEVAIGGKAQYGYQVAVEQIGGAHPDGTPGTEPATYEVSFDKRLLGAVAGNLPFPGLDPRGELGLRSADSVTMSFDTPGEAARAVEVLGKLVAEETLRDTASAISPAPGTGSSPAGNPVLDDPGAQTGSTPLGSVTPGSIVLDYTADGVGPSQQDMQFLQDHISRYSTQLDVRARLALEANLANLGLEGRFDQITGVRRTVELPQDGEPGRVTYTLISEQALTSKQRVVLGGQLADQFEVGLRPTNRSEHAIANTELDLSWTFDAADAGAVSNGRVYPEFAAASNDALRMPDELTMRMNFGHQDQNPFDLSRTDWVRDAIEVKVQDPTSTTGIVLGQVLDGNLSGARDSMGENFTMTLSSEGIRRDGFNVQPEVVVKAFDVVGAQASLIVQAGTDDVYSRRQLTIGGQGEVTPPRTPPANENQWVVVPRDGLNLRAEPNADAVRAGVFNHGTFVEATGKTATDASGRDWLEVSGPDVNNRTVTGWVAADYVAAHPQGAMDPAGGRINPERAAQGYLAYEVKAGDNVWDIARAHGVDFQDTMALNADHLIDASLVFPGDSVYLPIREPAVPPTPAEPPPEAPGQSDTGSAGTVSTGSTDSTGAGEGTGSTASDDASGSSDSTGSADDSTEPEATPPPAAEPDPAADPDPTAGRPDLAEVRREYQVVDQLNDKTFSPDVDFGLFEVDAPFGIGSRGGLTQSEVDALETLSNGEQFTFKDIAEQDSGEAYRVADEYYSPDMQGREDGHNDAFRHAYLNARLTQAFGVEFAEAFATGHEAKPGNPTDREAMDLYNNELGRRIATENPEATAEELARLVYEAVENGEALVIGADGHITWSDRVEPGATGYAADETSPGAVDARDVAVTESS